MTVAIAAAKRGLSPRAWARWAAALNLLSAVPDGFSVNVLQKSFVRNDAAATAAKILASEGTFRLGFVADLFGLLLFLGSAVLLYELFKPAGRRSASLYLVLMVMLVAFQALEAVYDLAALTLLKGGPAMLGLPVGEAKALAMLFLRLHSSTYLLGLFFGAFSSLAMASLILRATFVPRFLAPLMMLDGLGFLTFTVVSFLSPALATRAYPVIPFATVLVGEGTFYVWLLVKSVNPGRWLEQAARAA